MVKAIIFDCFGVLYLGAYRAMEEKFPNKALELSELTKQSDYGFIDQREYMQAIIDLTGMSVSEINKLIVDEYHLNQPLIDYIRLELKPHYKIGMLSNIGRGWIQNFFDEYQLHDLFDAVVLSGDEGIVKPHPQSFELIAERLGYEPEDCLIIDDLPENIAGADAAGMRGVVYGNLHVLQGDLRSIL